MSHLPIARALAALAVAIAAAGCSNDTTAPPPAETTLRGILAATNGTVGNLEITVAGDIAAQVVSRRSAGLTMPAAAAMAVLDVTGVIQLATGATVNVTGTWDTQSGDVSFSGGGYTFTGSFIGVVLDGTFTGPAVTGVFTMTVSSASAAVATYCGTITGTGPDGDPENGLLSLALVGAAANGVLVLGDQAYSFPGTVSGSTVTLTVPGGTASGTISGNAVDGFYSLISGSSGTWQTSTAGCTGAAGGTVAEVTLNPDSYDLLPFDSVLVFATARDAAGDYVANAAFTWDVAPTGVVAVHPVPGRTDAAWVVGVAAGTATVSATAGGITGNGTFNVAGAGLVWSAVSVGYNFSCGVATDPVSSTTAAYCWGQNAVGELGDGSSTDRYVPTPIADATTGPVTDWAFIEAGGGHACGITQSGRIFCWGSNQSGQLGGGTGNSLIPRPVTNPAGVTVWEELAVGNDHSCARAGTAIYCWGYNGYGKLGDNSTTQRPTPTRVADPAGGAVAWQTLAVGQSHSCAVTTGGDAYCWGYNSGNLGNNDVVDSPIPVKAAAPPGVTFNTISAGSATCAVSTGNVGYCWGQNNNGSPVLGDPAIGRGVAVLVPHAVAGGLSFLLISQGVYSTCGLGVSVPDGTPYCWGGNFTGQLGDNSSTDRPSPTAVAGNLQFSRIDTWDTHTCGINSAGELYCWGQNLYGQIGIGTASQTQLELVPRKVGP